VEISVGLAPSVCGFIYRQGLHLRLPLLLSGRILEVNERQKDPRLYPLLGQT
jgi:hypothetical protein